jgi:sec-independent protein translocase protein TatB
LGACASIAGTTVQNELAQELKLQEFQDSLKKVEKASMDNLTPELKASMDELREAAESMKRSYSVNDPEKASDEANTIHNPVVKESEAQRRRDACQRRASGHST